MVGTAAEIEPAIRIGPGNVFDRLGQGLIECFGGRALAFREIVLSLDRQIQSTSNPTGTVAGTVVCLTGSGEPPSSAQFRRRCIGIRRPVANESGKTIAASISIEGNKGEGGFMDELA